MEVLSEKRMDSPQTTASLSGSVRMEEECERCDFSQNIEDEEKLFHLEESDILENLMPRLKSEYLRMLRGAMNVLRERYERMFHTIFYPEGMEDI